jgi:Protein of unknown function (DUF3891)
MIRVEEPQGWLLVPHRDHARLAAEYARHWNNAEFAPPEPLADILVAVARHDDAWGARDGTPRLSPRGRPDGLSHEVLGASDVLATADLGPGLAPRGAAIETLAAENPYAAILVSRHTVSLLTDHAAPGGLEAAKRKRLDDFVAAQRARQAELAAAVARLPGRAGDVEPARLQRAFEFLQACDSLALAACTRCPKAVTLRHQHPRRNGPPSALDCLPLDHDTYRVAPYPFDAEPLTFDVPCRRVRGRRFTALNDFRAAYAAAPVEYLIVRVVR